ncbi:MAG: hypothetical protein GF315_12130 [candidate division Zixibacteria bacterium]|nr:hypothetical protein [candidate division Zixibacteria bacterium]
MNEVLTLTLSFLMGIGVGLFFFGVLLWAVKRIPNAKHPFALLVSSFFARLFLAIFSLFLISQYSGWKGLLIATAGFVLTKFVFIRLEKPEREILERVEG